jgi:hypothetical protein
MKFFHIDKCNFLCGNIQYHFWKYTISEKVMSVAQLVVVIKKSMGITYKFDVEVGLE